MHAEIHLTALCVWKVAVNVISLTAGHLFDFMSGKTPDVCISNEITEWASESYVVIFFKNPQLKSNFLVCILLLLKGIIQIKLIG